MTVDRARRWLFRAAPARSRAIAKKPALTLDFSAPAPGALLAVFASSAPIDPSRVRVQVQRRTFLAPLWDLFENTLTDRQTLAVDLDADGVPDLRVVISNDSAHTARAPT